MSLLRHKTNEKSLFSWLCTRKYSVIRKCVQVGILATFFATAHGWKILDRPVLSGDLSNSTALGAIPFSDPLALLERLFAQHTPTMTTLMGALIALCLYGILGSRTFCGWVCPMNLVTECADFLRRRLQLQPDAIKLSRNIRYGILIGVLSASALLQIAAFESISPQALLWRDVIYGSGLSALAVVLAIFAIELGLAKNAWCGHLCPLGAFWASFGKVQKHPAIRIHFDAKTCTHCGDCLRVCPEQQIIKFKDLEKNPYIPTGECLNCGRCIEICPEKSLQFTLGQSSNQPPTTSTPQ